MRRFMISFMPGIGVISIAEAIRTVLFGFRGVPLFWARVALLSVAGFYLLTAYGAWRVFIFYYKKDKIKGKR
jgi:hypothetical protein